MAAGDKLRLIVVTPERTLLDEPVAGMSVSERQQTAKLLKTISQGRSVVVIEHDMEFVKDIAHKVTVAELQRQNGMSDTKLKPGHTLVVPRREVDAWTDLEPDLMPIAKGLSSGYAPIGGVVIADRIADALLEAGGDFNHGYTYSGHPVSCAVAAENLRILKEEGIVERVGSHTAGYFAKRWAELGAHPLVGEARSLGLMGALELVADKRTLAPFAKEGDVGLICREFCFREGLIMRAVRDCMIVAPPLVISDAEIDELVHLARRCLDLTLERIRGEDTLAA